MWWRIFGERMAETESNGEYSATPEHDSGQSDSDPNFEETDESEDESNNEAVLDTLKSLDTSPVNKEKTSSRAAQISKSEHHSPIIRSRYNAHYFAKVNYLDSKNFGLAKIPAGLPRICKYCLQMETHNPKSPETFELDGSEVIVVDITNSYDAAIPTGTTNNSSMDFILVDYEDPMEEVKSPVQNKISNTPTGDATEASHNVDYPTMDNINIAEPMVPKKPH
ncbi:hypothetical protein E2562_017861 [Oryza meyeriana var. granulata]|uniref:Uncharacterized protein n=1 Tax=Oryza meyeriana var. granulata TaxID=110450 RepID=A0A6G1DYV4_9ORYZ|nr:hypothetical protein E2562_017861 [Oryza meyeriana var. granulata]